MRARCNPTATASPSRERLAKSDPGNAGWQRDLSVSYDKVGDVQVAQGDLAGALKSYRDSLAITERLAKSDPGNAGWQRDLSVSYNKVGDVQMAQGDLAGALKSYRDGLAIARAAGAIRSRQRRLAARPLGLICEPRRVFSKNGAAVVKKRSMSSRTVITLQYKYSFPGESCLEARLETLRNSSRAPEPVGTPIRYRTRQ